MTPRRCIHQRRRGLKQERASCVAVPEVGDAVDIDGDAGGG